MKNIILVFAFVHIFFLSFSQSYFKIIDKDTQKPMNEYGLEIISDQYEGFATLIGTRNPEIYTFRTWGGYSRDNFSGNLYLSANKATHMPVWISIDIKSLDTLVVELKKDPNYRHYDSELFSEICGERVYKSYSPRPLRSWSDLPLKASEAVKEKLVQMIGDANFRKLYISSIFEHRGDVKVALANAGYFKKGEKKYDICLTLSEPSAGLGKYSFNIFVTESGVILSHPRLPFGFNFLGEMSEWDFLSKSELKEVVKKYDKELVKIKPSFRLLDRADAFVWEYEEILETDERGITKFKLTSFDATTGELVQVLFLEKIVFF